MTTPAAKKRRVEAEVGALDVKPQTKYDYLPGISGDKVSEALKGAVPEMYNTPQTCPYGLYAEQLNGTAFTKPRDGNRRCWTYKIRPSAVHDEMVPEKGYKLTESTDVACPKQRRWSPYPLATSGAVTWLSGLQPYAGAGDPSMKAGTKIYLYSFNAPMADSALVNADGDFLIVPESGELDVFTELGKLQVRPGEICIVQRGFKFKVDNVDGAVCRGYVCELYDGHFKLPDLGPIGANGLANPRDFLAPTAAFENKETDFKVFHKFCGELFSYKTDRSVFDVVGWHGDYYPVKYDLARFCPVNAVKFDHLDPSIFTVLTCQTADPGTAAMDFVIFPPRYMVQMNTFRPPYYHKNCMSELMGNISGAYEAKEKGFLPGGVTLHSCMSGHGPDAFGFEKASALDTTVPQKPSSTDLAFMFESTYVFKLSEYAKSNNVDAAYQGCWKGLKVHFNPDKQ
eukprot:TRINITY_DN22268_c0_g2_i1.p1 TRINITY_DN22268_c0_g2~~TRINITY_DN22268_c0_g2_i1.p1  ORF type:complete len:455 (+),score=199.38 TRINITY_DN22268_c0_g2_i1:78-1442(+)